MKSHSTFRSLLKIVGQVLFVTGLALNVLMLCFGFWPSLVYLIIMLVGAGMFSFNKDINFKRIPLERVQAKTSHYLSAAWSGLSGKNALRMIKIFSMTFFTLFAIVAIILVASANNYRKRDTISDGVEIAKSLNNFHYKTGRFPATLHELTRGNPLRKQWTADHWGNAYQYLPNENSASFTLTSAGKDETFGTSDDIISHSRAK